MPKNFLRIVCTVVALALPMNALGAGVLRMQDTIVGLGTEARATGFSSAQALDLVVFSPSGQSTVVPVRSDAQGNVQANVPGADLQEAGTYRSFLGTDGKRLSADANFEVLPESVDPQSSTVQIDRKQIAADGRDAARVTVTLHDRYGNLLAGRPVELISSRSGDMIFGLARETDAHGSQAFTVSTNQPGSLSLQALDVLSNTILVQRASLTAGNGDATAVGGTQDPSYARSNGEDYAPSAPRSNSPYTAQLAANATASFGLIDHFEVVVEPKALAVNEVGNITIRAVDHDGQIVQDYVGTVDIYSPTDPQANVPGFSDQQARGRITFLPKNQGVKLIPLSVSFRRPGQQVLRVSDAANPNAPIAGETTVTITGDGGADGHRIIISSPKADSTVGGKSVIIVGVGSPYTNVQVNTGTDRVSGDTDEKGNFTINVPLDTAHSEYTFFLQDDAGNEASLHLVRDIDPPVILSAGFSPGHPQAGQQVVFQAQSEPSLPVAKLTIGAQELTLQEDPQRLGTYQVMFPAPAAGAYQPTLVLRDAADNQMQSLLSFTVAPKSLPVVQNLQAIPGANAVQLQWAPVTGESVDKYRIYIGEQPDNFSMARETASGGATKAKIGPLTPGVPYFFAVTAVKGDRESAEKSQVVSATPIGLLMTVTPQESSLFVEWTVPEQSSFLAFELQYGVEKDVFIEKRLIPGGDLKPKEKRSFTIRDLLPGVTYFVRVTPVSTTGDRMTELSIDGQGSPASAGGFHAAPGDPLPFSQNDIPPPNGLHGSAPEVPASGLPPIAWWLGIGITGFLGLLQWHRRRTLRMTQDFLQTMRARYRS